MRQAGIMLSEIAFSNFSLLCKNGGLDFFILDDEHGAFDYAVAAGVIMTARLCGVRTIVRLPGSGRKDIIKFADMGADGFLLPMTGCAGDIAEVVRYAKYRPVGERGISTMRAHTLYAPPALKEYMQIANARIRVYAQIETRAGVEHAEEILTESGVDGCFVGPNDLADDYGCAGGGEEHILSAIAAVGSATAKAGKTAGIITGNRGYLRQAKQCGFTMYAVGSELNAIAGYCRQVAELVAE